MKKVTFKYFQRKLQNIFVVLQETEQVVGPNIKKHICTVLKEKDAKTIIDILNECAELGVY